MLLDTVKQGKLKLSRDFFRDMNIILRNLILTTTFGKKIQLKVTKNEYYIAMAPCNFVLE